MGIDGQQVSTSKKVSGNSEDMPRGASNKERIRGYFTRFVKWFVAVFLPIALFSPFFSRVWEDSIGPLLIEPAISVQEAGSPHSYTFREAGGSRQFRFGDVEGAHEKNIFAVGVTLALAIVNHSNLPITLDSLSIVVDEYDSAIAGDYTYNAQPVEVPMPEGPYLQIIPKRFVVQVQPLIAKAAQEATPTLGLYTLWYPRQTLASGDEPYTLQDAQWKRVNLPYKDHPVDILGRTGLYEARGTGFDIISDIPPGSPREFSGKVFLACPGMLTFRLRVEASYRIPFLFGRGFDRTASAESNTFILINAQPPGPGCPERETRQKEEGPSRDTWDSIYAMIAGEGPISLTGLNPSFQVPIEELLQEYADLMGLDTEPKVRFIPSEQFLHQGW